MRVFVLALLLWGMATVTARAEQVPSPITGDITFFYYDDLPRAAEFYEKLLGSPPEDSLAWVQFFSLTKTAKLGLVDASHGSLRPSASKPVLLTLLVDGIPAVDSWYGRVQVQGIAITEERTTVRLDANKSFYAFMFKDPEGYLIEILSWVP